ncbi:HNH endonuclease [Acidithiobacillus caldus]|nr:RRXRR domain-containing protein [Acidithiobacillus caldus]MBU2782324.1 HNH endonuclease [Acidithiobacillus caldus]
MQYRVFVVDAYGKAGHPTRRMDWVRKILRRKQGRIIGGGISGKPAVLVLRGRHLDFGKTVQRKFIVALDTGYRNIGFSLSELRVDKTLQVFLLGILTSRTPAIRALMDERRRYRRLRRYHRRINVREQGWIAKHRPPRYESRGKRPSVTLRHGVGTHINLIKRVLKMAPVPLAQTSTAYESVSFDLRALAHGKPRTGSEYQVSPVGKKTGESARSFVIRRDGGCVVCGSSENLQDHHLRKRSRQGTDRVNNRVCLCADCHEAVHAGVIALPIRDGSQWRDTSGVNAICGVLRQRKDLGWHPVSVDDSVRARRRLGLEKTHALDAVSVAAAKTKAKAVDLEAAHHIQMVQFRRHSRAHIHSQRERRYYLPGEKKPVALNRNKRCDQGETPSLAEYRAAHPRDVGRLTVHKAVRLYAPHRATAQAVAGDQWIVNGQLVTMGGIKNQGRYLYSEDLKSVIGKNYVSPEQGKRFLRNAGMVVLRGSLFNPDSIA